MTIEVVQYAFAGWYVRITLSNGKTWHSEPWKSREAAEYHAAALREHPEGFMRRR